MNEPLRRAVFEDLARAEDGASEGTREAISSKEVPIWVSDPASLRVLREAIRSPEQIEALAEFVREMVHIALHSALVTIDGGSASASVGHVFLVDEQQEPIGEGLHELYVDYLFETGRLT